MPLVELDTVQFQYPGTATRLVLDGVSLSLDRGERIALQGTSGSGKSTLLAVLGLLMPPSKGRRLFQGQDTATLAEAEVDRLRAEAIGFVFQHHFLMAELTAIENAALPGWIRQGKVTDVPLERARELLDRLDLTDKADAYPRELSGGEQQRVAIARALINGPSLVLADEPTGNLDSGNGKRVLDLFQELASEEGCTLLLATHDDRVAKSCLRRLYIEDGNIVEHVEPRSTLPS